MPLVKIELEEGLEKVRLLKIRDRIMDCIVESLKLSSGDRNIRIVEYPRGYMQMKPPYEILVEITMFSGRTREIKRKLYLSIVEMFETEFGISKENIFIVLNEQPFENWGVKGGIPADEL